MRSQFARAGLDTSSVVELAPADADAFHKAISQAKVELGSNGKAVTIYDPEDYGHMRPFLTEDGKAGFALKRDDIVSLFSAPGRRLLILPRSGCCCPAA